MKMIRLKFGTMVLSLLFLASTSCAQHQHAESTASEETPLAFQDQLKGVFDAAQNMNDAFVASDPEQVQSAAKAVTDALGLVDMKLLQGKAHMDWMENLAVLNSQLKVIRGGSDLSQQRKSLVLFSDALYQSVKRFGIAGTPAYLQYCPMANGNTGASWLSNKQEIQNPYFGAGMLTCGSTKEIIE